MVGAQAPRRYAIALATAVQASNVCSKAMVVMMSLIRACACVEVPCPRPFGGLPDVGACIADSLPNSRWSVLEWIFCLAFATTPRYSS